MIQTIQGQVSTRTALHITHFSNMAREAQASKPEITIFLRTGSSTTYSTHDKVEGTVSITAWHATDFADLSLQLCGK